MYHPPGDPNRSALDEQPDTAKPSRLPLQMMHVCQISRGKPLLQEFYQVEAIEAQKPTVIEQNDTFLTIPCESFQALV